MKAVKVLLMTVFLAGALSADVTATDEDVRHYLVGSMLYIDNPDGAEWDFQHARELCGTDTNRFARLICEIARTNDSWIARGMIDNLGAYGTAEQLPFLYSQISNATYGASAVRSILRIEGLTSNSVAMVDSYLSMTNVLMRRDREDVCIFMLDMTSSDWFASVRKNIERTVLQFAANNSMYNRRFDKILSDRIGGYPTSLRRLRVLRTVQQRGMGCGMNQYTQSFVTNAINELVAYPEADLPE